MCPVVRADLPTVLCYVACVAAVAKDGALPTVGSAAAGASVDAVGCAVPADRVGLVSRRTKASPSGVGVLYDV